MDVEGLEPARLIPVTGIGSSREQEGRVTSALLAVLTAVEEFSRELLKPLGAPPGSVSAFTEVRLEVNGQDVRPDGLIQVTRGKREWNLLVEVKTGTSRLDRDQMEPYLEAVRAYGFDGLLTISNHISQAYGHHHVDFDRRRFRNVPLHHLSWLRVLSLAQTVKLHRGVSDPDQAWILSEFIRYLQHKDSGIQSFEDMGPHCTQVRSSLRSGALRSNDASAVDISQRWDQLVQFVCLEMAVRLGDNVRPMLSRREAADPELRTKGLAEQLARDGELESKIRIPGTVSDLWIRADLKANAVNVYSSIPAPDRRLNRARLNWILRELKNAPDDANLEVKYARTRRSKRGELREVANDPRSFLDDEGRTPRQFIVTTTSMVGVKRRRGKGSFIDGVADAINAYYSDVLKDISKES